jgi:hypothetical protein
LNELAHASADIQRQAHDQPCHDALEGLAEDEVDHIGE